MVCDASWTGHNGVLLATPARQRPLGRLLSNKLVFACGVDGTLRLDCRWYNPERRESKSDRPKPVRRWVGAEDLMLHECQAKDRIVLLSYNILGDNNASKHPELYWNIPSDVMNWNSRKRLICNEISKWNADILCLQEVDNYVDISTYLKKKGYIGGYKARTGGAKDGCALFWKARSFKLLEADNIEFSSFGLRNNVAQLFVLQLSEDDPKRLVVGNIHVLFNPKRGDIKLAQVHTLLLKASQLSEKWGGIPVLLAGDFNSTPKSAVYEFLSTSKLNVDLHGRRMLFCQDQCQLPLDDLASLVNWTSNELSNAIGSSSPSQVTYQLLLRSSYASVLSNARTRDHLGEPLATSYHSKFLGTVDYIWYSSGLACTRVLDTLPLDVLRKFGGLPCGDIGSDHLSLAAEFIFTEGTKIEQQRRPFSHQT